MLTTIGQFQTRVERDFAGLISDLQSLTGRYGSEEAKAWGRSLRQMSRIFRAESFSPLHLFFGSRGGLALEYQLPASCSWCDVVLLGAHEAKASAIIIELKDWQTSSDEPGSYEGLVLRNGMQELHPSDQVRGYTEYCRRFHSAVQDHSASVHGCVLLTRDRWRDAYTAEPNTRLASEYPLFTTADEDLEGPFPAFLRHRLTEPHEAFASAFEEGRYRQRRGFVAQIGAQILDPSTSVFELLDGQRRAFAHCRALIRQSFHSARTERPNKRVVIVRGPPGSGKSVIAVRLWAALVTDQKLPEGDVIMATTSTSQNKNWAWLFDQASHVPGARGVVRKATGYTPITTQDLGNLRKVRGKTWLADAGNWRDHLKTLRAVGYTFRENTEDNANLVSIIDEAHALINPEHVEGRGQFGFVVSLGPQAYHIIRSSLLSVFLLDPLQGYRERENTSIDDIRDWSRELGAGDPIEVSLEGLQFRCGGSSEYVSWVESVLAGASAGDNARLATSWHQSTSNSSALNSDRSRASPQRTSAVANPPMDVRLFEDPETWEAALRQRYSEKSSVRLLATYARPWNTKTFLDPHVLSADEMDFHEKYHIAGKAKYWSRIWNFVPNGSDYTWFVSGHPAGRIATDPLCEVGCPYAVRGFDYDYAGILWLDDMLWRGGRWQVNPEKVHESGIATLTRAARGEAKRERIGPKMNELLERVGQAYRILFTRALKGVYVWVPDAETRSFLGASLG